MSVIPEQTSVPAPPPAAPEIEAPPALETPAVDETVTDQTIAAFNAQVEKELTGEPEPVAVEEPVVEPVVEVPVEAEPVKEGEEIQAEAVPVETTFKLGADIPIEEFVEQKKAYLESVEITPELQSILDRQEAELTQARAIVADFDGLANKETVAKLGSAVNRLYEGTDVDPKTGAIVINAKPLVEFIRTDLTNEFRPIAEEILSSDSAKYQGASMLEEFLIDSFGADKASKMVAFGHADAPLPVMPAAFQLPAGVEEKNKEAFWRMPEVKRFEIQSLVDDINQLSEDRKDASEWNKEEIGRSLAEKREKLEAEIYAVGEIQRGIDSDRDTQQRTQRQQAETAIQFRNKVNTDYNTELFGIAETFAADLAPRLTYADSDTQLSQARNVMSRVNNALAFIIESDGSFTPDPMAEFYAKQLTEEGLKYDFGAGRDLLQKHYKACERLTLLTENRASPQAIEVAKTNKRNAENDIKVEQKQLLGQLSGKYVKSNGTALTKQVDAIRDKKQAVKVIANGKAERKTTDVPVKDAIADYNRRVAAATGEELFEFHNQ